MSRIGKAASSLAHRLAPLGLCAGLSACVVPIPYSETREAPSPRMQVPAAWLTDDGEVLVLIQHRVASERARGGQSAAVSRVSASYMRAGDLDAFKPSVHSRSGVIVLFLGGPGATGTDGLGTEQRLELLCIVSPTGFQKRLLFRRDEWVGESETALPPQRRGAIVSALRTEGDSAFDRTDGPCGASGVIAASDEVRKQMSAFFAAMPDHAEAPPKPAIAMLLDAMRPNPVEADALLLATARLRAQTLTAKPLLLNRATVGALLDPRQPLDSRDFAALFPDKFGPRSAGKDLVENLLFDRVCLIERDGAIHQWSPSWNGWRAQDADARSRTASLRAFRALREDAARSFTTVSGGCLTEKPASWIAAEFSAVAAFALAMPPASPVAPHPAAASLEAMLREPDRIDVAEASALLLVISYDAPTTTEPLALFLSTGRSAEELVTSMRSTRPDQFGHAMATYRSPENVHRWCVVAANGQQTVLARQSEETWQRPAERRLGKVELAQALRSLAPASQEASIQWESMLLWLFDRKAASTIPLQLAFCELPAWNWNSAGGEKVRAFLQRIAKDEK